MNLKNNNKLINLAMSTVYEKFFLWLTGFFNGAFEKALNLGESLISFAVVPIIVYYFLSESQMISNKLIRFFPVSKRKLLRKVSADIDKVLGRYVISQFLLCFIIGVLTLIILMALDVSYPLLLSVVNAVFNIVPYFGPLFGAIPAIIVALLRSPQTAIWTAICLYIIQQLEGDVISPKITGDSVCLHPLMVIILLIIGGKIGGIVGMVLAIPVGVILKIIYEDLNYYLF
jgi:predicted PurR-regulated permease PerM